MVRPSGPVVVRVPAQVPPAQAAVPCRVKVRPPGPVRCTERAQAPPAQEPATCKLEIPRHPATLRDRLQPRASAVVQVAVSARPSAARAKGRTGFVRGIGISPCLPPGADGNGESLALEFHRLINRASRNVAKGHGRVTECKNRPRTVVDASRRPDTAGMASSILVVEDDPDIGRLVCDLLRREGFAVDLADAADAMDAALARARPDLMILDVMLPGEDGLSICRRIRASGALPILMLTAKSEEIDRVLGLELGADDYLVKPFGPRELLARVRALLRRAAASNPMPATRAYAFEGFAIDLDARQLATAAGEPVALTSAEFDLLACLVQRPRRVLTRDQILDWTRGRTSEPFDRTVDMLISRLRRKLELAGGTAELIATVRNGGYLFSPHVRPAGP
jgi:DNA-binding response OmpR family regulator